MFKLMLATKKHNINDIYKILIRWFGFNLLISLVKELKSTSCAFDQIQSWLGKKKC